jgi:hypothetical protein
MIDFCLNLFYTTENGFCSSIIPSPNDCPTYQKIVTESREQVKIAHVCDRVIFRFTVAILMWSITSGDR